MNVISSGPQSKFSAQGPEFLATALPLGDGCIFPI